MRSEVSPGSVGSPLAVCTKEQAVASMALRTRESYPHCMSPKGDLRPALLSAQRGESLGGSAWNKRFETWQT